MALLAAGLLGLGSCGAKSHVDELKEFVEKVEKEGGSYTKEQWQKANEELSELLEKLDSYEDMTPEELQEVARLQGQYAAKAFKEQAGETMEKAGALLNGLMQGLTEEPDSSEESAD